MDFCNKCGSETDPDWVFCRSCGNSFDDREAAATSSPQSTPVPTVPKVELISRGWDVVDVDPVDVDPVGVDPVGVDAVDIEAVDIQAVDIDTATAPADPLEDDDLATPLVPGTVEISVDDVTVVEHPLEDTEEEPPAAAAPTVPTDRWDHLRPHGQIPGVREPSRTAARVGQIFALIAAVAALVSSVLYLVLNIQLERYADGTVSEQAVSDIRNTAEASLLVLAGLAAVALLSLGWWMVKAFPSARFRPGPAGMITLPAFFGGTALVAFFALQESSTVADDLTANSLVVLGLGLIMVAGLSAVRTVGRIEGRVRR